MTKLQEQFADLAKRQATLSEERNKLLVTLNKQRANKKFGVVVENCIKLRIV